MEPQRNEDAAMTEPTEHPEIGALHAAIARQDAEIHVLALAIGRLAELLDARAEVAVPLAGVTVLRRARRSAS